MTAATSPPRLSERRRQASTTRLMLTTLIAVGAVVAMHGVGPHHTDLLMDSAPIPTMAMAMAPDAEAHDHGGSPHDHHAPASPHDLVALCAVIVLAAATLVTRRPTSTRHEWWSPLRLHELGTRPDPPVPRPVLAFN